MSNGDKKPGLRDISDLKARLGMLNKGGPTPAPGGGGAANPFGPKGGASDAPAPKADLTENPDAEAAGDTQVVRVGPPPGAEPPTPAAPRANLNLGKPASAPPGPAPLGGPLNLGSADELFRKKEPTPPPPAAPPPSAAPAAPAAEPEPPPGVDFANPLQRGAFREAAPSIDLSAEEQAQLDSFEGKQRGVKPGLAIAATLFVGVITAVFGFFIGDVRTSRRMINAQIDASIRVKDAVEPLLTTLDQVAPIIRAMNPNSVEFDKVQQLPAEPPNIDGGLLLTSPIPLEQGLNRTLSNFVTDVNMFFTLLDEHRKTTLGRDKAALESLSKGEDFFQNKYFAVLYTPLPPDTDPLKYVPPEGRVVAVTGKPLKNADETAWELPVVDRQGKEKQIPVTRVLRIEKNELMSSGDSNALTLYEKRVERLQTLLKRIQVYEESLKEQLKTQAARSKVFSI